MTLRLVNNIGTENKKNCEAKRIFHYTTDITNVMMEHREIDSYGGK